MCSCQKPVRRDLRKRISGMPKTVVMNKEVEDREEVGTDDVVRSNCGLQSIPGPPTKVSRDNLVAEDIEGPHWLCER